MDIHKAQKLITALNRIGYNGEINPDNIDQLFLSWSSLIVLENLTEWLLHDCPSRADLERYPCTKIYSILYLFVLVMSISSQWDIMLYQMKTKTIRTS